MPRGRPQRSRPSQQEQDVEDEEIIQSPIPTDPYNSESSEDMDSTEDSEDDGVQGRKKGGRGKSGGGTKKSSKSKKSLQQSGGAGGQLTLNEMVHNALVYFLLMQHKKYPVKRSEVVKHALNMNGKAFSDVISKLEQVFADIFGMRLVGLDAQVSQRTKTYSSYTLSSKYSLSMSELVTERPIDFHCRRSCLFLILTLIFMLNRPVEEDAIWSTISSLGFDALVCKRREDLKRFIRSEYVATMYLHVEEISENDRTLLRYSWGPRAELEFSKYAVLKFAARQFPGKKPADFAQQYLKALEHEKDAVEADESNQDPDSEGLGRSAANRSSSSHELISDVVDEEEDPEQVDLDMDTDNED